MCLFNDGNIGLFTHGRDLKKVVLGNFQDYLVHKFKKIHLTICYTFLLCAFCCNYHEVLYAVRLVAAAKHFDQDF